MVLRQEHVPDAKLFGAVFEGVEDGGMARPAGGLVVELGAIDIVGGNAFFFHPLLDLRSGQLVVVPEKLGFTHSRSKMEWPRWSQRERDLRGQSFS